MNKPESKPNNVKLLTWKFSKLKKFNTWKLWRNNKKSTRRFYKSKPKLLIEQDGHNSRKKPLREKQKDRERSLKKQRKKKTIRRLKLHTITRKRKNQLTKLENSRLLHWRNHLRPCKREKILRSRPLRIKRRHSQWKVRNHSLHQESLNKYQLLRPKVQSSRQLWNKLQSASLKMKQSLNTLQVS